MRFQAIAAVAAAALIAGCAKAVDEIEASYVSPLAYEQYTCEQLAAEAVRVSENAARVMGAQQKKANEDAAAMAVGLVLFWPAVFFVKGGGASENEVARMKGEMDTIEKVAIQKECGIAFQRPEEEMAQATAQKRKLAAGAAESRTSSGR